MRILTELILVKLRKLKRYLKWYTMISTLMPGGFAYNGVYAGNSEMDSIDEKAFFDRGVYLDYDPG
ncbi:hypothetical protein D3C73_1501340 [compost metagenome]